MFLVFESLIYGRYFIHRLARCLETYIKCTTHVSDTQKKKLGYAEIPIDAVVKRAILAWEMAEKNGHTMAARYLQHARLHQWATGPWTTQMTPVSLHLPESNFTPYQLLRQLSVPLLERICNAMGLNTDVKSETETPIVPAKAAFILMNRLLCVPWTREFLDILVPYSLIKRVLTPEISGSIAVASTTIATTTAPAAVLGFSAAESKSEVKELVKTEAEVDVAAAATLESAIALEKKRADNAECYAVQLEDELALARGGLAVANDKLATTVTKVVNVKSAITETDAETKGMGSALASYVSAPPMLTKERKEMHDQIHGHLIDEDFQRMVNDKAQKVFEEKLQETYNVMNDPNGGFLVGCLYLNGQGVPQDPPKALTYFTAAADKGHIGARAAAGYMGSMIFYYTGKPKHCPYWIDLDQDVDFPSLLFLTHLKFAADAGDISSQFFFGRWYLFHSFTHTHTHTWMTQYLT